MTYLDVGGCNLYYEDHSGPEDAATLIFLHGAAGNHISWWQQIPYFSKNYRCITIDHRGFCWSEDKTQEGGSRFVEDLKLLLDELGIKDVGLICQSMGGRTGLGLSIKYPERVWGLVMGGTWGFFDWPEQKTLAESLKKAAAPLALEERAIGNKFKSEHPQSAFLYQQIANLNPPRNPNITSVTADTPTLADVKNLSVPVFALVGKEDVVIPAPLIEAFANIIDGATYLELDDLGHSVYFENPALFNELVDNFLETI